MSDDPFLWERRSEENIKLGYPSRSLLPEVLGALTDKPVSHWRSKADILGLVSHPDYTLEVIYRGAISTDPFVRRVRAPWAALNVQEAIEILDARNVVPASLFDPTRRKWWGNTFRCRVCDALLPGSRALCSKHGTGGRWCAFDAPRSLERMALFAAIGEKTVLQVEETLQAARREMQLPSQETWYWAAEPTQPIRLRLTNRRSIDVRRGLVEDGTLVRPSSALTQLYRDGYPIWDVVYTDRTQLPLIVNAPLTVTE